MTNRNPDEYIFMQDGAPAHTAKETIQWLRKRMNILINWPPNSPDLNPIEHLWGLMKRQVQKQKPKTKKELVDLLQKIWSEIPMEIINNLVASFEERLNIVCNVNGECINEQLRMKKMHVHHAMLSSQITVSSIPKMNLWLLMTYHSPTTMKMKGKSLPLKKKYIWQENYFLATNQLHQHMTELQNILKDQKKKSAN